MDKLMTAQFPVEERAEAFYDRLVRDAAGFYAKDIARHDKTVTWTLDFDAMMVKIEEYGLSAVIEDPVADYVQGMRQTVAHYGSDFVRRALLNGKVCVGGSF